MAEVAERLQLSLWTVYRNVESGELPAIRLAANALRFRESEIEAFLLERSTYDDGPAPTWVGASRPPGRIAYAEGNICLVNADGSRRRCLTRGGIDYGPVWSADGRRLAFVRVHDDPVPGDRSEILIMGTDGRGKVKLTPAGMQDSGPAWSPVAPRIAFTRRPASSGRTNVFVANADGSGVRELMPDASYPAWSPDGRKIAFTSARGGVGVGIYVMNADGTKSRMVRRRAGSFPVAWSPDGRLLLFVGTTPGFNQHVFVMNANGSGLRRLTRRCKGDSQPSWSPDGERIAFTCFRTNTNIFSVSVDGTHLRRLTSNRAGDSYPAWSPDGKWLAYVGLAPVAHVGQRYGLFVMLSDGTERQRILPSMHDSPPAWDPVRK